MKLQWAFGNPRGGGKSKKKKKSKKKNVAKRHKRRKLKSKPRKKKVSQMAKRKKRSKKKTAGRAKRRGGRVTIKITGKGVGRITKGGNPRGNPFMTYMARKDASGKLYANKSFGQPTKDEMDAKIKNDKEIKAIEKQLSSMTNMLLKESIAEGAMLRGMTEAQIRADIEKQDDIKELIRQHKARASEIMDYLNADVKLKKEQIALHEKNGWIIVRQAVTEGYRKAKKKKAKGKKKVAKKSSKKKAKGGRKKGGRKKGGRKKAKTTAKMVYHSHSKKMLHIPPGTKTKIKVKKRKGSFKIKAKLGTRKGRRGTLRGVLKVTKDNTLKGQLRLTNPRRNPMTDIIQRYTGLSTSDLQLLAVGAAAAPLANALLPKIPFVNTAINAIASKVPVKYQSPVVLMTAGVALNALADVMSGGTARESEGFGVLSPVMSNPYGAAGYLHMIGEGMAAAAVIGFVASAAGDVLKMTGFAGVNYTPMGIMPELNGVNYTPMSGVEYTPIGGPADFGSADYGGGGGYTEAHNFSPADFGAWQSSDSEAVSWDDENSYATSMN